MTGLLRNDHDASVPSRAARLAAYLLLATGTSAHGAEFRSLCVPASQSVPERAATQMLVEEAARRTLNGPPVVVTRGLVGKIAGGTVLLARRDQIADLLPRELVSVWERSPRAFPASKPEGFTVVSFPGRLGTVTILAGNDPRGELFAAGWLLRQMHFASGRAEIPDDLHAVEAPEKPVRGHQIGYRFKNNTYDAWNLAQFEQQIRDLAIFGGNTIQLIAPNSDDQATSPLNPAPPLETLLGISALLKKYGLDCDLYYPEMRPDYTKPDQVEAELKDFEALVRAMPQLDALYFPGGDPGHTPPEVLFPLVAREVAILHRYHPRASVWISAQGFDRQRYETFYRLLQAQPEWLNGVFFGPQSRDSFFTQRRRIPARYAMQFYPDIAHTMHAQFPVPQWDPIWALTEGREPICPRPAAFTAIYRHFAALHRGFVTYSEGVNDDVNKMLWNQLGWSSETPVDTILAEYARWFLHREGAQQTEAVDGIKGLEADWNGPIPENRQIAKTYALFADLERNSTPRQIAANGRWESLLYRANYDDYVQRKLARERSAEAAAIGQLSAPGEVAQRVAAANQALAATEPGTQEQTEHDRLFTLAGNLFHDWGLQLSVKLYGASNWERGANLDRVDTPLTEAVWLKQAMQNALGETTEAARAAALQGIVDWPEARQGAIYDDLGEPASEPHLVRGPSWQSDPELYDAAIDGIADRTLELPWRLSWIDYAETLYEQPLELRYRGLNAKVGYRVRVTYAGEDYALPLRLTANGIEVHPARLRKSNPETVEFAIPDGAIQAAGDLTLAWVGPSGSGGSGRGRQVAEVWLIPQKEQRNSTVRP